MAEAIAHADEALVREHCSLLGEVVTDVNTLKEDRVDLWKAVNALRNRLPTWAVLYQNAMMGMLGFALGIIYFLARAH